MSVYNGYKDVLLIQRACRGPFLVHGLSPKGFAWVTRHMFDGCEIPAAYIERVIQAVSGARLSVEVR